jgi:ubiquinone/menaquinone biosynthesis C-methylase UbiE
MNHESTLRDKILLENQKAHDWFAPLHDEVCSYISRKACKDFYINLILIESGWNQANATDSKVLELGCGTGTWASLFPNVKEFVGVDVSKKMIDNAKRKHPNSNFRFECGDVKSFLEEEIKKGTKYDLILSSSFLHHLYDIDEVLNLIGKVLNKNGVYLAIHEPRKPLSNIYDVPLPLKIDSFISFLQGYDCDLAAFPLFKRLLISAKRLVPFKKTIKRLLGKKSPTKKEKAIDFDFVDYKLSDSEVFHPIIFTNKKYPGIKIYFDFYTYYTYPFLKKIFGDSLNYFWVKIKLDS